MNARVVVLCLLVLSMGAAASPPPATGPSPAIVTTIRGVVAATNANDPARVNSYFAIDSVVVDDFPPYLWNGAGAGGNWWRALKAVLIATHTSPPRVTMQPITIWKQSAKGAYVVVPLTITFARGGTTVRQTGLWALTLQPLGGGAWVISSASWATVSQH
jgi:hypothetical protein